MWEDSLGKVKTKRNKTTKPYERPKSILRRVTDSVTGLIPQPSWLASWLHSSASKESEIGTEDEEEPVPSTSSESSDRNTTSVRDTARESFIFQRPPGSTNERSIGSVNLDLPSARPNVEPVQPPLAKEVSVQTINGDDDSHSESTSGCSSLLPHPEHRTKEARDVEPLNINQSSLQMLGASLSKSIITDLKTSRPSRKTLSLHTYNQDNNRSAVLGNVDSSFNDLEGTSGASFYSKDELSSLNQSSKHLLPQPSGLSSKRPRFNITTFGPVAVGVKKSSLNESIADSPFYAGRTTYGGASAYRRAALHPSLTPYPDVRKRLQARPSSICSAPPTPSGTTSAPVSGSTASHVVLSSSAQKILHALEAMSTPVADAKRIPTSSRRSSSASVQEDEPSFTGYGLGRRRPNLGPPTAKLSVGRPAIVVSRASPVVSSSSASITSSVLAASTPISSQGGTKMRTRVTAPVRASVRSLKESEELVEPELPAVSLPVSGLPSFNLLPPPASTPAAIPPPKPQPVATNVTKSAAKPTVTSAVTTSAFNGHETEKRPAFTFAAPLVTVSPSAAAAIAKTSKPLSFSFSSPLYIKSPSGDVGDEQKPVEPITEAEVSSFKPASELKTGSVMDILRKETSIAPQTPTRPVEAIKSSASLSFGQPLPVSAPITTDKGFGDKFKPPSNSWTCSVCCISNSMDKAVCAACESPNPNAAKSTPAVPAPPAAVSVPSFGGFGDKFKMTSNQWECSTCLVRNPDSDNQCKSCETPRPGSAKAAAATKPITQFKFGLQPSEDKSAAPAPASVVAAPSTTVSGFKISTVTTDATSGKKTETGGFKFGASLAPAKTDESGAGGFKFGASLEAKVTPSSTTTATEAGGFKFGASLETKAAPPSTTSETGGFKFGAAAPSVSSVESGNFKFAAPSSSAIAPVTATSDSAVSTETTVSGGFKFGPATSLPPASGEVKKTESSLSKLLDTPPSLALSSAATFGQASTMTTSSKTMPIFSFGPPASQPKPSESVEPVKPASELKTGSVLDVLLKKPESTAPTTTSTPSLSFGTGPVAASTSAPLTFGKAPEVSTAGTTLPFGFNGPSLGSALGSSKKTEEQPTSKTFELPAVPTSVAAPSTFAFGSSTAAPSLNLFKPTTTTAPSSAFSFGASVSTTASTAPTFGSLTTTTSAGATPVFTFGSGSAAPTTTTAPTPSSGVFSFGQQTTTAPLAFSFGSTAAATTTTTAASTTAPPSSVFQFGSKEAAKPAGFGFGAPSTAAPPASTTTPSSLFAFGTSATVAPATTQPEAPKSIFAFGSTAAAPAVPATSAPTFGTFSTTTQSPFSFGTKAESAPTITPFGAPPAASAPSTGSTFGTLPAPGFGSSTAPAPAVPFAFGASSAPTTAAPMFNATPSFNFGSTGGPPAVAPAAAAPAPGGVFTFGSASAMQPSASQGFSPFGAPAFGAGGETPAPAFGSFGPNPFDVSSGPSSSQNRKIRKAVRRR